MKTSCVLFGAGADIPFRISGGREFAFKVLGIDTDDMNSAIKKYFREKLPNYEHNTWYPPYDPMKWEEKDLVEAAVRKNLLSSMEDTIQFKKEYDEQVKANVKKWMQSGKEERYKFIENNTSYMGLIDEKFHTIISPKVLGPKKFWSVISCYIRAYLLIVGDIIAKKKNQTLNKDDYEEFLRNPAEAIKNIDSFCDSQKAKESYYSILSNVTDNDIRIITTNYTPLCQSISGVSDDKIAHIHGKLNWFESPYNLKIYDVPRETLPNELCFPYLFIQSGIKPIVDAVQIREYAKMLRYLEDSDQLIIVGYRLNSDDNHINGIIRSYLEKKEVVFLDFEEKTEKEEKAKESNILRKLRVDSNKNFKYIKINSSNGYSVFRACLEQ